MNENTTENLLPEAILEAGQEAQSVPLWFSEEAYLNANPDVADAVLSAQVPSGYWHYINQGQYESRTWTDPAKVTVGKLLRQSGHGEVVGNSVRGNVEAIMTSRRAGILVIGWMDDRSSPIDTIVVTNDTWQYKFAPNEIFRSRRRDVESALSVMSRHSFGFMAFAFLDEPISIPSECAVEVILKDGSKIEQRSSPISSEDEELRNRVLSGIVSSDHFGNPALEAIRRLEGGFARPLLKLNGAITNSILPGALVRRFGPQWRKPRASLVVCLYGKMEYLFIQNALFSQCDFIAEYEIIYVCNSPELNERLLKEARAAELVYGLSMTLVLLSGNAGFGAANNIAAQHAKSNRIIIINPDVFPYTSKFVSIHDELISGSAAHNTKLFGVPLYYDDGSLMHGGMYFEFDEGVSIDAERVIQTRLARVEHYGKGTPPNSTKFTQSRPVPAVTGAFMSIDRDLFEQLGGFTQDFIFGHYEDADLCLKSLERGVAPWLHDLKLWHLEGKGSLRLPIHEAGSLINRWLFTKKWSALIESEVNGQHPSHKLLQPPPTQPAVQLTRRRPAPIF